LDQEIDIGFHINKDWNKEQLEKSKFISTIKTLENMGFRSVSFRLFKDFNLDNGQELTPEESAKLPLYQIFQLYIDPNCRQHSPRNQESFRFCSNRRATFVTSVPKENAHSRRLLWKINNASKTSRVACHEAKLRTKKRQRTQTNQRHSRHLRPIMAFQRPVT